MKNVAILMPHWIGEFVLALSVISRKAERGDESITLLVPQHLIPLCTLLTPLPYFPYRRSTRKELLQCIAGVKQQHFDKLYILTHSLSTAWFGLRTGIPIRRGVSSELLSPFLTQTITPAGSDSSDHLTRDFADILEVDWQPPEEWQGGSVPQDEDSENMVALCPGTNHGPAKQWQGFRDIVKLLPSYDFIILGDSADVEYAKAISSHLPHRVRDYTGKTTIEAAASILAAAPVVISNHSGLMHLAGYLGTPVVGIFGSTSAKRHRPLGRDVRCATAEGPCTNCNRSTCARKDYICLTAISPDRVIALAGEIVRQPV
jgi:heptosyltransferase-2